MIDKPFPPLDPDDNGDEQEARPQTRLRDIPLRTIFPNLLTLLAICSGLTAIRFAIEGRIELAIGAIILAAFLDGIDGRVARFLKSTTRFGAQMDSLADFVNFGVAPAMILYFSLLLETRSIGWIVVLIYAICCCLRLARFNVMLDDPNKPKWQNNFFEGVPAPAAAMIALLPVYLSILDFTMGLWGSYVTAVYILFVAYLMISSLPTFSGKEMGSGIPRDWALPLLILAVALVALLFTYPWGTLVAASLLYLAMLPIALRDWNKKRDIGSGKSTD